MLDLPYWVTPFYWVEAVFGNQYGNDWLFLAVTKKGKALLQLH